MKIVRKFKVYGLFLDNLHKKLSNYVDFFVALVYYVSTT
jgi:hypothetical protein